MDAKCEQVADTLCVYSCIYVMCVWKEENRAKSIPVSSYCFFKQVFYPPYRFTSLSSTRNAVGKVSLPERLKIFVQKHTFACCLYVRSKFGIPHAGNSRRWNFIEQGVREYTVFAPKRQKGRGCWKQTRNDTWYDVILFTKTQYCSCEKMKENEMAGECVFHWVNKKAYRVSARKHKGRSTCKTEE